MLYVDPSYFLTWALGINNLKVDPTMFFCNLVYFIIHIKMLASWNTRYAWNGNVLKCPLRDHIPIYRYMVYGSLYCINAVSQSISVNVNIKTLKTCNSAVPGERYTNYYFERFVNLYGQSPAAFAQNVYRSHIISRYEKLFNHVYLSYGLIGMTIIKTNEDRIVVEVTQAV